MSRRAFAIAVVAIPVAAFHAAPARAGAAACRFENNVVVAGAELMGVPGDVIIDTATPHTLLADSQAQTAGFTETALSGEIRVAGVTLADRPVAVSGLDLRTGALFTPIEGVIGADVLGGFVVDVSFRPCRLRLSRPGHAPPFRAAIRLPIAWIVGRPTVRASAADGPRVVSGAFAPAISADTAVRLSDADAQAPGALKPKELYPYGVLRPRLRALSFAGTLWENLPAGLIPAEDPRLLGQVGSPVLARYRLRFDFPRGELLMQPEPPARPPKRKGPRRPPRP